MGNNDLPIYYYYRDGLSHSIYVDDIKMRVIPKKTPFITSNSVANWKRWSVLMNNEDWNLTKQIEDAEVWFVYPHGLKFQYLLLR